MPLFSVLINQNLPLLSVALHLLVPLLHRGIPFDIPIINLIITVKHKLRVVVFGLYFFLLGHQFLQVGIKVKLVPWEIGLVSTTFAVESVSLTVWLWNFALVLLLMRNVRTHLSSQRFTHETGIGNLKSPVFEEEMLLSSFLSEVQVVLVRHTLVKLLSVVLVFVVL